MKHIVLVNPISGTRKGKKRGIAIIKLLKKYNIKAEMYVSKYSKDLTNVAHNLAKKEKCRFYTVGGDGTLNEVVSGIVGTDSEIVVIPCGTGNDFVKSISKYMSLRKIIHNSINASAIKTDVIKINNNRYCINILNSGFDAMVAKNVDKFRMIPFISGKSKYNMSIIYTLLKNKNFKFKIKLNNENSNTMKGYYTLAAICNGKFYGGGICPCNEAITTDGFLNTCIIDSTRVRQKIVLLPKYQKGNHYNIEQVHINKCKTISIVSTRKFPVSIDGEIIYTNRLKATVLPKSINIVHIT